MPDKKLDFLKNVKYYFGDSFTYFWVDFEPQTQNKYFSEIETKFYETLILFDKGFTLEKFEYFTVCNLLMKGWKACFNDML